MLNVLLTLLARSVVGIHPTFFFFELVSSTHTVGGVTQIR